MYRILLVTHSAEFSRELSALCNDELDITACREPAEYDEELKQKDFHLILLDFDRVIRDGFSYLQAIVLIHKDLPVITVSEDINAAMTVQTIKSGAVDAIRYPGSIPLLRKRLLKYIEMNAGKDRKITDTPGFEQLIGGGYEIRNIKQLLARFAPTNEPVLILGESGCGKNVAAQLIHNNSRRKGKPFYKINTAAIPESLIESELFGTVAGAYTGAVNRTGYFEASQGGTLFLDEIGEMPLAMQAKILQALESNEIRRLGSGRCVPVDIRFIFATNRNLKEEVRNGRFREDLYYRLAVLTVEIPPLRMRKEDIPLLAEFFLSSRQCTMTQDAKAKMLAHSWPGNIRELKNCLIRASILCVDNSIKAKDITF